MEYYNKTYAYEGLLNAITILNKKGPITYQDIFRTMVQRCNTSYVSNTNGLQLLIKENIDHFMVKELLENNNFDQRYLEIIKKDIQLTKFPGQLTLQNHFLNTIPNEKLKEVLPDNIYQEVVSIKEHQEKKKSEIMKKNYDNEIISQSKLDYICDYFAFNRDKNNTDHRKLIEYIFENLPKKDCKLQANTFVSDAILSFIPKVFKTKENNDFSDVRIINHSNNTIYLGFTFETTYSNALNVFIDRRHYSIIDFKRFNDVDNLSNQSSTGLVSYLQTIFHELTHIDQQKNSKKTKFIDNGYMSLASKIFRTHLKDYNLNHDNYEIEINADQKAWLHIKNFFQEFIKDEDLKKQLIPKFHANSIGNHLRRSILQKIDRETNKTKETDLFNVETLNQIIRKNPSLIKTYPILKTFY